VVTEVLVVPFHIELVENFKIKVLNSQLLLVTVFILFRYQLYVPHNWVQVLPSYPVYNPPPTHIAYPPTH